MIEAGIGRLLVASLHQGIADLLPTRLEFYESWLNPAGLRDGFLERAQRLATAMVTGLGAQGSFVAVNNIVSQSVPHLHCHVVPRNFKDGLRGFFWPRTKYADDAARDAVAAKITKVLAGEH